MDFGIAKSLQTDSNLTQTGITLGTSAYLAPEQIRGEPIDARTDIFAMGVLSYELVTYRKPFRGEHLSTVLYKILNDSPEPIATLVQDAPPALIAAIDKAIAKSADDRYASMEAFRADLQAVYRELCLRRRARDVPDGPHRPPRGAGGAGHDDGDAVERRAPDRHHASLGRARADARGLGPHADVRLAARGRRWS